MGAWAAAQQEWLDDPAAEQSAAPAIGVQRSAATTSMEHTALDMITSIPTENRADNIPVVRPLLVVLKRARSKVPWRWPELEPGRFTWEYAIRAAEELVLMFHKR